MSKGPGQIEQRIGDLFAATRHRALSIDEITDHAFALGGAKATRVHRLSATRATHRLLRRVRDATAKADKLAAHARANTEAALGRKQDDCDYHEWRTRLDADPAQRACEKLSTFCERIGMWGYIVRVEGQPGRLRWENEFWCATTEARRLYFHPPDVPIRIWAVSIQQAGVIWADAEIIKITERNVMVRYAGEIARLDRRKLHHWWAFFRGVRFASTRTGRIAAALDELWQQRYGRNTAGGAPPAMQMPLARAMELLGVPANYTYKDVIAAFRRAAKKAHPDAGGNAELFRLMVEARDRLLASIGTSAPAPQMPKFAPTGAVIRYRTIRSSGPRRLGSARLLAHR